MKLTDICPPERWRELEEKITALSGLDANVYDPDGYRITAYKHWANRLCPAIKGTDKGQSFICAVAQMNLAAQARKRADVVMEACDAGLLKMVVPIFFQNEFIGSVGACGLLTEDDEIETFLTSKITEIEEVEVERLSENIGRISIDKLKSLAGFIKEEVRCIIAAKKAPGGRPGSGKSGTPD